MADVDVKEGTFAVGGQELHTKTWTPKNGNIKAKLVFVHGFSDHVDRYYGFFPHLASQGIQVLGFDQRGWGRSAKKASQRGQTGPTSTVMADLAAFIRSHLPSKEPVFIMGHSMGGGEVLTLAVDPAYTKDVMAHVRGIVLESAFIGFHPAEQPTAIKVAVGRLAAKVLPRYQLYNPLDASSYSRDPAVVADINADELCHDTGSLEGLGGLLDRTGALASGKVKIPQGAVRSMFMAHGTEDKTCAFDAAKKFFDGQDGVDDKTFKAYEGYYHQLHSDYGKEVFYDDVASWILARSGDEGVAAAAAAGTKSAGATASAKEPAETAAELKKDGDAAAKL